MKDNYSAFEKWYKILDWIMDKAEKYPRSIRFSFANRLINIAIEILENLIVCIYSKKKISKLKSINISVEKLRIFFRLSYDRKYISMRQYEFIANELDEFGKMIGGWIRSCEE